ncbi:nSTAND3 domain-containing NTPase [Flavivirga rizhaonensis]|uniref:Novel STAND NTPase 3 domain-containing protein n=1 Tax=Flavivirga rizhaonensis TaxID=2559571 RepID=A0A4S1DZJ1_9FLAO|nr:hypothetical protein [Flavivirga rizhaonensis]TGV03650.1 hypothetical protein EM932_06390 [Flavivirga rizhaonensis]
MGAKFALKGYRTQFLYSLFRILTDYAKDYTFCVEGEYEDLDILDNQGDYLESIQVKNKQGNLNFSDLFSSKDSFFKRALKLIKNNKDVKIKIVSFGDVSDELIDKNRLGKKLKKKNFNEDSIKQILNCYVEPEIVDESILEETILDRLKVLNIFTDPKVALELLLFWIYKSGENQIKIDSLSLLDDLNRIGKFLTEQNAFHSHYGNTIIPIKTKNIENENIEKLREGFFYGISAKYEHILANLDVLRSDKLNDINKCFKKNNVVFIHGASGQGKSTLAYRYLHDYIDSSIVYELKISNNLYEVQQTINSLDSLSKGLKFPVMVYLDVKPQNEYWNDVLKELSNKTHLQFLITIRQEDWNRTILGDEFDFDDIELNFNREEAKVIYELLSEYRTDLKFTDFEESWIKFGNKGMLLEYIYLINQGDKLKIRLQNQINRLENESKSIELEILRYVCLADSFNSKIDYKKIINLLNVNKGLSNSFVKLLEKEYLLKFDDDKKYLTGLHPIRSKILSEIFFNDNDYLEITDYIKNSIPLVNEQDLHSFLLNSFENGLKMDELLGALSKCKFVNWIGYLNTGKALLWKGVYDFIFIKNKELYDQLYNEYRGFWTFMIPYDYSGVSDGAFHNLFEQYIPDEVNEDIRKIQLKFTPKADVYEYLLKWLINCKSCQVSEISKDSLKHLGEFLFYIGHLNLTEKVTVKLEENKIRDLIKDKLNSIEDLSILLLGIQVYQYSSSEFIEEITNIIVKELREKYNIIFLSNDDELECLYFFDPFQYEEDKAEENFFHATPTNVINILRNVFPFKNKYSVRGTGKAFFGIELPYDPSVKNIERKNLPIPYLVEINVLLNSLYSYQYRPDNWSDYSALIHNQRTIYNTLSRELIKSFIQYFRKDDYSLFGDIITKIEKELKSLRTVQLPKSISDKWGYISEGQTKASMMEVETNSSNELLNKRISINRYKNYRDAQRDYFFSLENFLNQIGENILSVYKIRIGNEIIDDYNPNQITYNIKNAVVKYSNFNEEFNNHFEKYLDSSIRRKVERIEMENIKVLFFCWKQFLNQKGKVNLKVFKNVNKAFADTKTNLTKRIKKVRQKIFDETGLSYTIEITDDIQKKMILTCEVDSELYLASILFARSLVQESLNSDYFSLKGIIVELNVDSVIYIPLFMGNALNQLGVEIYLHNLDKEIDDDWNSYVNFMYFIDDNIIENLKLSFWNQEIDGIKDYESVMGEVSNLKEFINQINHLKSTDKDDIGELILNDYVSNVSCILKDRISSAKNSLKLLESNLDNDKLYKEINDVFEQENLINMSNDLEEVQNTLTDNYHAFSQKLIDKYYI